MYPHNYFSLFPPFRRKPIAFVAMSFSDRANKVWREILEPAISRLEMDGQAIKPFRVDLSKKCDAILTEILDAIANCSFIVGDISAYDILEGKPIRSANVLYEVGIAHAARLPEEVILFRSDSYKLDFDIAGVRVHQYDENDIEGARTAIVEAICNSLDGLNVMRMATVKAAAQRLTYPGYLLLCELSNGTVNHPSATNLKQAFAAAEKGNAIQTLLNLGAIESRPFRWDEKGIEFIRDKLDSTEVSVIQYEVSAFGVQILRHVAEQMGMNDPAVRKLIEQEIDRPPA